MDYQVKGVLDSLLQRMEVMEARMLSLAHLEQQEGERQAKLPTNLQWTPVDETKVCYCGPEYRDWTNPACPIHGKKQESTTSSASSVPTPGPAEKPLRSGTVSRREIGEHTLAEIMAGSKSTKSILPELVEFSESYSTLTLTLKWLTRSTETREAGLPGPALHRKQCDVWLPSERVDYHCAYVLGHEGIHSFEVGLASADL